MCRSSEHSPGVLATGRDGGWNRAAQEGSGIAVRYRYEHLAGGGTGPGNRLATTTVIASRFALSAPRLHDPQSDTDDCFPVSFSVQHRLPDCRRAPTTRYPSPQRLFATNPPSQTRPCASPAARNAVPMSDSAADCDRARLGTRLLDRCRGQGAVCLLAEHPSVAVYADSVRSPQLASTKQVVSLPARRTRAAHDNRYARQLQRQFGGERGDCPGP